MLVTELQAKIADCKYTNSGAFYTILDGGTYPRVSSILSMLNWDTGLLAKWQQKKQRESFLSALQDGRTYTKEDVLKFFNIALEAPNEYGKASAIFGNKMHDWLETYLNTWVFPDIPKDNYADTVICAKSMQKFIADAGINKDNIISVKPEMFLYSKLGYAGVTDWLAQRSGEYILFDWKTSNYLHEFRYKTQVSAYWHAIEELYKIKIAKAFIVQFGKDTVKYNTAVLTQAEQLDYFDLFKCGLYTYRGIKGLPITGGLAKL
jgi:hypothetical protein